MTPGVLASRSGCTPPCSRRFPSRGTTAEVASCGASTRGATTSSCTSSVPDKPDLTHLVESIGRPTYGWQTRDYGPFLDRLADGERWAFRLLANPVHNVRPVDGGRGKRVGHVTAEQQTDWFREQAGRHGFAVVTGSAGEPDLLLRSRRTVRFTRRGRDGHPRDGRLRGHLLVEDPVALRAALVGGIGPGKGYGCGLLTLAAP